MGKKAKQEELPGMEARDVPEIEQAAENYRRIRDERCELSKRESEAKAALIQVMKNLGRSFYQYNGLKVQLEITDNVKVRASEDGDEEPSGTFTQPKRARAAEIAERWMDQADELIEQQQAAAAEPSEEERERLHREAVATWRREPIQIEPEEDDGGTPFPTEYSQEDINLMADYYAAQAIAEEKRVRICYVDGQPHVITAGASSGDAQNWASVKAWPILPLENVGEENAKTYKQASDEYYQRIEDGGPHKPLDYTGVKVNCRSKKNPDWWVMVGPEMTFTVKQEAPADDFTAPRCDECKRTDGAHTKECSKNPARLTSDDYLAYAQAHYKTNHQSHARKMALTGVKDDEIRKWKLEQQQASNSAEAEPTKTKSAKLSPVEAAIDR